MNFESNHDEYEWVSMITAANTMKGLIWAGFWIILMVSKTCDELNINDNWFYS